MLFFGFAVFVYLIAIYPILDKNYTEKLKQTLNQKDRISYFKYVIYSEWLIVILILIMIYFSSATFSKIGFVKPETAPLIALLIGNIIGLFISQKLSSRQKNIRKQFQSVFYLVPTGTIDKRYAIVYVFTKGICEEIIYRGFLLYLLSSEAFNLNGIPLMIIGSVIFALPHFFQGWKSMIEKGFIGLCFILIYLIGNSLYFPIFFRIISDFDLILAAKTQESN